MNHGMDITDFLRQGLSAMHMVCGEIVSNSEAEDPKCFPNKTVTDFPIYYRAEWMGSPRLHGLFAVEARRRHVKLQRDGHGVLPSRRLPRSTNITT